MDISEENLRAHHVWVPRDSAFQKQCRLQQALWREANSIPIGHKPNGDLLGSRIEWPRAKERLENFITPTVREVVRAELDTARSTGKLFGEPRIYDNLLSSQPLCFNLFGELSVDLKLATRVLAKLEPQIDCVTKIRFEHSPGRGDPRYTGDHSAFDVFVEYNGSVGKRGFLGIEVKYHEALTDKPTEHKSRYDELAAICDWWTSDPENARRNRPLQQMWRDHLLAASIVVNHDFDEGVFVFLAPAGNNPCIRAVLEFQKHVTRSDVFRIWSLEDFITCLASADVPWLPIIQARYGLWNFAGN
jgi:hypothetical protein